MNQLVNFLTCKTALLEQEPLYEAGQQSTRQLMAYFQIGSRRTLYKILRFAGCQINEKPAVLAAKAVNQALP